MIFHLFIISSAVQIYEFSYIHYRMYVCWFCCRGDVFEKPCFALFCSRRKAKGKKSITESTVTQDGSQEIRTAEPQTGESSQTGVGETSETQSVGQREDTTRATTAPAHSAQASQVRQTTCTPLNTPSHLYGATPLNTAVTTGSLTAPPSQRIPILFGFVTPLETSTVSSSQAPLANPRIPVEQSNFVHRNNSEGPLNTPPIPAQCNNLSSMSAQELQQVVISRMLASDNTEGAFVPPNMSGFPLSPASRPPVLLPHVHSLLNPSGVSSGGEVTVWPFSPSSGMFQQ